LSSLFGDIGNIGLTASTAKDRSLQFDGRIQGFDGLRAIAFLLVFASDKIYFAHAESFGDVGVRLFFVLSGFLITRILARSSSEIEGSPATTPANLGGFYLRRTARFFPPYYLLLAFFAAGSLFTSVEYFGRSEKLAIYSTARIFSSPRAANG
jgi:peptidoglycan/LPS O-acetylase OafA/YrhL